MPEAKSEAKSDKQQQIKEILAGIESGIQNLFQSNQYRLYLQTMAKFHRYSLNNTILIFQQRPDATHCAGFQTWKTQFGRYVRKGEKGIKILAPAPIKKTIQVKKLDPVTQAPMRDAHGAEITEDRTIQIPRFKVVTIFDVSQTEGKPMPEISADLVGDVEHYEAFMEALRRTSPVPIEIKPLQRDVDGFFSRETQSITLREGMSQIQTVCAAIHEIVHSALHNEEDSEEKSRANKEVEAESVAMAVSSYFHIDTSANSIPYLTTWSSDKTLPELRVSLETITKTTSTLISDIERHFGEVCKEWGIASVQPEQAREENEGKLGETLPPVVQADAMESAAARQSAKRYGGGIGSKVQRLTQRAGGRQSARRKRVERGR